MFWPWLILLKLSFSPAEASLEYNTSSPIPGKVQELYLDQFGNQYLHFGEEIRKRDADGKFIASYSDPIQGNISGLDLLNPMNPLIYYRNSNLLRVLDNRLNTFREHNLSFYFQDPATISAAAENRIWIYDQNTDQMMLFSLLENRILNRSPILSQIINDQKSSLLSFQSGFDRLLVHMQTEVGEQILIFDGQGAFLKKLSLQNPLKSYSYFNHRLALQYQNSLLEFIEIDQGTRSIIINPQTEAHKVIYYHPKVYFHAANKLWEYRLH